MQVIKYKIYSGAGNDFVMINNMSGIIAPEKQKSFTADICKNNFPEIDGVIFLDKPVIANSGAAIRMSYYNRDGSFGAMCGNGARCTASFAKEEDVINANDFFLEAVDNIYRAEILPGENVRITFPDIIVYDTGISINSEDFNKLFDIIHWVDVGSEHIVVFIDDINYPKLKDIEDVDVQNWGSYLRYFEDMQPVGANVNFVEQLDNNNIRIRTYERGVERETLACGTGIVSSAIISSEMRELEPPIKVKVQSGEELVVNFDRNGDKFTNVSLEGSARKIGEGELEK